MKHLKLLCILLTAVLAAAFCIDASAQFKEEAFTQQYNDDPSAATDSTLAGIVTVVRPVQSAKVFERIATTFDGITISVRLQLPSKRDSPIEFTSAGIVRDSRCSHHAKAASPMLVTLSGISIVVNVQPWKAASPIAVTLLGITVFLHPEISLLVDFSMMALQLSLES